MSASEAREAALRAVERAVDPNLLTVAGAQAEATAGLAAAVVYLGDVMRSESGDSR